MKCSQCSSELKDAALFCPQCGTKVATNSASETPASNTLPSAATVAIKKVMSTQAKVVYSFIAVVLLIGMGVVFVRSLPGGDHPIIQNQPTISQSENYDGVKLTMTPIPSRVENGFIVISLAQVVEKKMVSFTYDGKTTKVDMMAYINPQGKLVTSIAMCEPCNSKSFHSESQDLVCDNCGTRWNFTTLEGISGACQKYPPDPIPSEIVGNEIRINKKLVEEWKLRI